MIPTKRLKPLTTLAIAAGLLGASFGANSYAQEYALRFQHSDQAGNPNYVIAQKWAESLMERSGGQLSLEIMPVGSIVEHQETQDAVGAGIIDGHITDASYFAGKDAAFALIGNPVGAWSDPQQMFDYMNKGGGKELMNELVQPYGLQFIGAATPGLEAFVSKIPIMSVADLKGVKMRAPEGLVNQVFAAAGAAPVNLPSSEVFTSLDKGVIDAADFSVFSTNQAQGLNEIATHPIYPGFHSMPLIEVSMNKEKWDSMPVELQTLLEESVVEYAQDMVSQLAANDEAAIATAADEGITIHNWPDEERAKFRSIAAEQWISVAEKSPNAQKVYDHLTAYLKQEGLIQ